MTARIITGDCRVELAALAEASVDAIVTDPPYELGFMGKGWDSSGVAFDVDTWRAAWTVLKPGGHLLAFSGSRTYHRMVCAIEDAGFEIRDQIMWIYGSGFPKSMDVSKAIDKAQGDTGTYGEPKSAAHAGWIDRGRMRGEEGDPGYQRPWMQDEEAVDKAARQYVGGSDDSRRWQGWGTALKPAHEPIVVARKPLIGTVAANVLAHGTGALNIDACRIGPAPAYQANAVTQGINTDLGRWPANLIHDGSEEVVAAFPESTSTASSNIRDTPNNANRVFGRGMGGLMHPGNQHADSGSAARFFYSAKATAAERHIGFHGQRGNTHATVKPLDLMQYLCRLVTPPGGLVLDPFCGSGSTGIAADREGFDFVGIELDAAHAEIARRRFVGDAPLFAELDP